MDEKINKKERSLDVMKIEDAIKRIETLIMTRSH